MDVIPSLDLYCELSHPCKSKLASSQQLPLPWRAGLGVVCMHTAHHTTVFYLCMGVVEVERGLFKGKANGINLGTNGLVGSLGVGEVRHISIIYHSLPILTC